MKPDRLPNQHEAICLNVTYRPVIFHGDSQKSGCQLSQHVFSVSTEHQKRPCRTSHQPQTLIKPERAPALSSEDWMGWNCRNETEPMFSHAASARSETSSTSQSPKKDVVSTLSPPETKERNLNR